MRKRILLAEESDTIRGVAESVLRQNGYEVIAVTTGSKALEVLNFTRPDLLITGSDLVGPGGKQLYEIIQADPRIASLPQLIFCNTNEAGLPFPEEVLVPRPFDPKDFIEKVGAFAGQTEASRSTGAKKIQNATGIEDELLDAALGLGDINVTDSEVMEQSSTRISVAKKEHSDHMIGYEHGEDEADSRSDSGKVESLMIHDDTTDIKQTQPKVRTQPNLSGSSKLDILSDQYGLIESKSGAKESEARAHDYDWFINEMQDDGKPKTAGPAKPRPAAISEGHLSISDPSSLVDPITPGPQAGVAKPAKATGPAVDKFIDEFKKEIEKIHSSETESITLNSESAEPDQARKLDWEDTLEQLTPQRIEMFSQQFASELAERLAEKISAKIDSEKLLSLLKTEIFKHLDKNHR